jgi:aspartate aminotransferase
VRALCDVAADNDMTIICDEIYRDLVHDPAADVLSPAAVAPHRTVVTTALSKSLALGGWRIGAARLPEGPHGDGLRDRLLGIISRSGPRRPRLSSKRPPTPSPSPHRLPSASPAAGACTPRSPAPWRPDARPPGCSCPHRRPRSTSTPTSGHGASTCAPAIASAPGRTWPGTLERYGAGVLPASVFGEPERTLRVRVATGLLYGDSDEQRETALTASDPLMLPWISAALTRIEDIVADLAPPGPANEESISAGQI